MIFLLDSALRVAVIVGAGLLVAKLLPRTSAATRHSILAAAMLCGAVAPVVTLVGPELRLALPAGTGEVLFPSSRVGEYVSGQVTTPSAPLAQTPLLGEEGIGEVQSQTGFETKAPERTLRLDIIWLSGVALTLAVLLIGWSRLAWIAWRSRPVLHGKWMRSAETIARDYRLRRRIHLLQSRYPGMLATWGLLRPKVVLPRDAEDWHSDRIQVVLCHELAHVRRHDVRKGWAPVIARSLDASTFYTLLSPPTITREAWFFRAD